MISLRSSIVQKLLTYLFLNQEEERYIRELAKILDADPKNLYNKLKELEVEGILKSESRGRERYYFLNKEYPLLNEYKKVVEKTIGLENIFRITLKKIKGIKEVYIFGSYASNKLTAGSDIDLLVIGSNESLELYKELAEIQKRFNREVNVIEMSIKEFNEKRTKNNPFLKDIFSKPIIKVI